jgi:hypothetical protein
MPKKRLNCFIVLGGVNLEIASTFLGWGWRPVQVSQSRRYLSSSAANSDLRTLALKPAFSRHSRQILALCIWSSKDPFWMTPWQRATMIVICFKINVAHSPTVHHLVRMGAGVWWAENWSSQSRILPQLYSIVLAILCLRGTFVSCEVRAALASHLFYTSRPYPALLVPALDLLDFAESIECNAGCRMTPAFSRAW